MGWNHFAGSLLFAVLAALGFPAARLIFDPMFGATLATQFYGVVAAALYALCIAPTLRRGIAGGGFVALLAAGLMLGGSRTSELALGLAVGVAVTRSALLYRARIASGVMIEVALGLASLALARWFAGPGVVAGSLALWGYFLVQSVYFLFAAAAPRRSEHAGDAFDEACGRLQTLLRETGS